MNDLAFTVTEARVEPHAMSPTLVLRLQVASGLGSAVHAAIVRSDLHLDVARRQYTAGEGERLVEVFGARERWADTMRPLFWTQLSFALPSFTGRMDFDLPVPCTYDFEVASAKYFHALDDGIVPIRLMFSGSVFTVTNGVFQVRPIPWDIETSFRLPVATWRDVMQRHFFDTTWIRLRRESFDALYRFRAEHALPSWESVIDALCAPTAPREAV
ncbi:MAG TPA: DUF6084 family protein [Vicinamibacterales bacterium]|jgi:hypothetical protein